MKKLDFDFNSNGTYTAEYKGYNIKVTHSENHLNPLEDMDGFAPTIVLHGSWNSKFAPFSNDSEIENFLFDKLTEGYVRNHQKELAEAFFLDFDDFKEQAEEAKYNCGYGLLTAKVEILTEAYHDLNAEEKIEAIETVFDLMRVPCVSWTHTGYVQGNVVEGFTVLTDDFIEEFGNLEDVNIENVLNAPGKIYAQWAFGDVYAYSIEDSEGEMIDSCSGFFGDDFSENGLEEYAIDAIEYEIEKAIFNKIFKVKTFIKNKVGLLVRQRELVKL